MAARPADGIGAIGVVDQLLAQVRTDRHRSRLLVHRRLHEGLEGVRRAHRLVPDAHQIAARARGHLRGRAREGIVQRAGRRPAGILFDDEAVQGPARRRVLGDRVRLRAQRQGLNHREFLVDAERQRVAGRRTARRDRTGEGPARVVVGRRQLLDSHRAIRRRRLKVVADADEPPIQAGGNRPVTSAVVLAHAARRRPVGVGLHGEPDQQPSGGHRLEHGVAAAVHRSRDRRRKGLVHAQIQAVGCIRPPRHDRAAKRLRRVYRRARDLLQPDEPVLRLEIVANADQVAL